MQKEKDLVRLALLSEMKRQGCPVCRLIDKRSTERAKTVLSESVLDTEFRKDFLDAQGFCGLHAEKVLEGGRPLSHAILYQSLMGHMRRNLGKRRKKDSCLLCELERTNEEAYVRFFAQCSSEKDFFEVYREGSPLCFCHLEMTLKHLRRKSPERKGLLETTNQKYDALFEDLEGIKRKSRHEHAHEAWTKSEQDAWKRVVRLFTDPYAYRRKKG